MTGGPSRSNIEVMFRAPHLLLAVVTAATGLAWCSAATAAPWSAPAAVAGPRTAAPTLAFDGDGLGVLAADAGGDAATGAIGPHTVGALARSDAFGPLLRLTPENVALSGDVVTYAKTRLAGLGTAFSRTRDRAGLVLGRAGETPSGVRYLGPADRDGLAEALAGNTRGDLAGSYGTCIGSSCARQRVYLVARRSGRPPQRSIRIDDAGVDWMSTVAVNTRGDSLIAWEARSGVFARIHTAGGKLSPARRLGDPGEPVTAISAVLTPSGAAAVAWSAQNVSDGDPTSSATVDAALKDAGTNHRFHTSQRLETVPALGQGRYVAERRVKLARTSEGDIDAAWTGYQNGRFVVQTAGVDGFRFGAPQTVSDPTIDSVLADLAAGPSSELAVLWRTGVAGDDPGTGPAGLEAALRPAGATQFGAAENILQGLPANNATLRFDPSSDRAVAAWNDFSIDQLRTSVRAPTGP
jgi:hypothetical protein